MLSLHCLNGSFVCLKQQFIILLSHLLFQNGLLLLFKYRHLLCFLFLHSFLPVKQILFLVSDLLLSLSSHLFKLLEPVLLFPFLLLLELVEFLLGIPLFLLQVSLYSFVLSVGMLHEKV